HADETINESRYAELLEYQLAGGVAGVVVAGTTGEYYALTADERNAQFALARDIVKGRAQLIAGCNAGATRDAIGFAALARELGYDAIMLAGPPTSLPNQRELAAHVQAVATEGGLPVVLYNYPARAGIEFGFESLDAIADLPEVIAIKESSGDFSRFLAMKQRYEGRITVMCGSDDQCFDYMAWGVRSWLAGTANVLPAQHAGFVNTMLAGNIDLGRAQYAALLPWIQHMEAGSYNQKVKAGLKHLGVDCGGVRRPLLSLPDDARAELLAVLDASIAAYAAASAA
ncbi:MAG: dihydrodipicolinate synthase family protein, partial [Actinobacteria bacterium]|nr:dihydrodipicolinate synthase family protein [Actinomycetota bacterium]